MENSKNYHLLYKLGEGSTSDVYLCKINNSYYAIKILKDLPTSERDYLREISMLKKLKHPNITNLISNGYEKLNSSYFLINKYYLILDLASKGELFNYIYFPQKGFTESQTRYIFKQILLAVNSCHLNGVAHLDIKTENLMLDDNFNIKLADFGLACSCNDLIDSFLGTENFQSPEILERKLFNGIKSDIFALGVTLFIIYSGEFPFKQARKYDISYQYIIKRKYDNFWNVILKKVFNGNEDLMPSNEFKDLFIKMICPNEDERISIQDIFEHPWMKLNFPSNEEMRFEFEEREKIVKDNMFVDDRNLNIELFFNSINFAKNIDKCDKGKDDNNKPN